ncbi:hypothetical protein ABW12_20855 [Pluralibacter gergoviae]|nr:hypothetical protein ABW12_20855 [Pluralibacter gergoviae]
MRLRKLLRIILIPGTIGIAINKLRNQIIKFGTVIKLKTVESHAFYFRLSLSVEIIYYNFILINNGINFIIAILDIKRHPSQQRIPASRCINRELTIRLRNFRDTTG